MQFQSTKEHAPVIRQMAVKKVFANIQHSFKFLQNVLNPNEKDASEVETPHNIFGWSQEDLEDRLKLENMAWLDIFKRNLSKNVMGKTKLQIDINELIEFTKLLYEKFDNQDTKFARKLNSALTLLDFPEKLKAELNRNVEERKELLARIHPKMLGVTLLKQFYKKIYAMELLLFETNVYDPIQKRYQIRYKNSLIDQYEDSCLAEQNRIKKEIKRYSELMRIEKYCSQCTVNALYTEANKYRTRLDDLDAQYAKKYEAIKNKLASKHVNLEKIRAQRSFLEDEILHFREEIANVLQLNELQTAKLVPSEIEQKNTESPPPLVKKGRKKKKK